MGRHAYYSASEESDPECPNFPRCCKHSVESPSPPLVRGVGLRSPSTVRTPPQRVQDRRQSRRTSLSESQRLKSGYNLLIVGGTGTGKSSFIKALLRDAPRRPVVGESLQSCTAGVECFSYRDHAGRRCFLIDTPGLDDSRLSDAEVLTRIAYFLMDLLHKGLQIHGVIFIHRITDVRLSGSSVKTAEIIKLICGEHFRGTVAFVTSMWDLVVDTDAAIRREHELLRHPQFWGSMCPVSNRRAFRIHGKSDLPAQKVISWCFDSGKVSLDDPPMLQLVKELRSGQLVSATDAGQFIGGELSKQRRRHIEDATAPKRHMARADRHADLKSSGSCESRAVHERDGSRHVDPAESHLRIEMPQRRVLCY